MKYTKAVLIKNGLLQKIPGSEYWIIKEEFIWYVNYGSKRSKIVIPKGFKTNFGSIPKLIQNIFPPTKYLAYVLHDYLYSKDAKIILFDNEGEENSYLFDKEINNLHVTYYSGENTQIYAKSNRKFADQTLKEAIQVEGGGYIERNLIYIGVRIGGKKHFNT